MQLYEDCMLTVRRQICRKTFQLLNVPHIIVDTNESSECKNKDQKSHFVCWNLQKLLRRYSRISIHILEKNHFLDS